MQKSCGKYTCAAYTQGDFRSFLEQNQSERAFDENLKGGFYFHPSDQTCRFTPSSRDRSLGDPVSHLKEVRLGIATLILQ
jgi:hypothetical protein